MHFTCFQALPNTINVGPVYARNPCGSKSCEVVAELPISEFQYQILANSDQFRYAEWSGFVFRRDNQTLFSTIPKGHPSSATTFVSDQFDPCASYKLSPE